MVSKKNNHDIQIKKCIGNVFMSLDILQISESLYC